MTHDEMRQAIHDLPLDGWSRSSGEDIFQRLAAQLVTRGFEPHEAVDLLSTAYGVVANEFGD